MALYNLFLHFFPKSFRLEYGEEMRRMFARRLEAAIGIGDFLSLWIETVVDVIPNSSRLHWDILSQDLRFTARSLARKPGFTLTAILVAALGIGATTAAFSVTDRVLIRPLPFMEPDRLVKVWENVPGYSRMDPSPANFRDWQSMAKSFDVLGAYTTVSMNLIGGTDPMRHRRDRQSPAHARRAAASRPTLPAGGGRHECGGCGGPQLWPLAGQLRGRRECDGHGGDPRRKALHRDRHHAS